MEHHGDSLPEQSNSETPMKTVNTFETPYIGMVFETVEEVRNYYEDYGRQEGFWIRTRSSSKTRSRSNEVNNVQFVCVHQGKHESNKENGERNGSTVKGGCNASMRIKYTTKWEVSVFNDTHNHKVATPFRRMKMMSNRHMPKAAKDLTEAFQRDNIQIGKVPSILGGALIGFDNRDCYNHLRNVRHRELECGDAQSVLTYFRKKQAENPQFFYAIQCDENGRASNFFWVDARSRLAYQYFGDVVSFDTTYRTNKYDMPFAPFTGVNHHFQSIQFGCALLQDETETTFVWLFETWLAAMGGHHPISIITDQDMAMRVAISKVFPNSRHRLCLWHIKKKFVEKLSHIYFKKSKFKFQIKKCIWSLKINDFEERWAKLMNENGLETNEWLQHLYEIRANWVPAYNRGTFYAGLNTTGRSEGVNAFFDDFVTSQTNLREFVIKYEQALAKIVKRESDEDFVSEHKYRIVREDDFLLKQVSQLCTRNLFNKFKDEWDKVNQYRVEEGDCVDGYHTYLLKNKMGDYESFAVKLNLLTHEGECECKLFEFLGLLCRHILKVFVRLDIDTIPDHYVLTRWRQEANKFRVMDSKGLLGNNGEEQTEALRLNTLCQASTKLACYAAHSVETYSVCMEAFKELSKKLECIINQAVNSTEDVVEVDDECSNLLLICQVLDICI